MILTVPVRVTFIFTYRDYPLTNVQDSLAFSNNFYQHGKEDRGYGLAGYPCNFMICRVMGIFRVGTYWDGDWTWFLDLFRLFPRGASWRMEGSCTTAKDLRYWMEMPLVMFLTDLLWGGNGITQLSLPYLTLLWFSVPLTMVSFWTSPEGMEALCCAGLPPFFRVNLSGDWRGGECPYFVGFHMVQCSLCSYSTSTEGCWVSSSIAIEWGLASPPQWI